MKYGKLRFCDFESICNRIGGEERVQAVLRGQYEIKLIPTNPTLLVNRVSSIQRAFSFMGNGAEVWNGPLDGDGKKGTWWAVDRRSVQLEEIRFDQFEFKRASFPATYRGFLDELFTSGTILLDAQVAHTLYHEKGHRTLEYFRLEQDITKMTFFGTIIRDVYGTPCVLELFWDDLRCKWEMTRACIIGEAFSSVNCAASLK